MWDLDHKESWVAKNWCFWTSVLEKTLESPLDCREIKPVHPKGNQSWIFIEWTDAEAPILWLPDVKNWLFGKDPDPGKDWRQEKGMTEDKMVGWHHRLDGHEFEQALGVCNGQGGLTCCSPWGCKELDTTELNMQESRLKSSLPRSVDWRSNLPSTNWPLSILSIKGKHPPQSEIEGWSPHTWTLNFLWSQERELENRLH